MDDDLSMESEILVLGIGNILWADEGFGVRAMEALQQAYRFPPAVRFLDGGTQGLYLLPYVKGAKRLLVFDAIDYGLPAGSLKLVRDADIPAYLGIRKMSLHQSSFQEVLALAMLGDGFPQSMLLIGVQPEDVSDYGGSLRDAVRARIPEALNIALETLADWGALAVPRDETESAASGCDTLSIDAYEQGRPGPDQAWRSGDARVANQVLAAGDS
ncbi:MAG: HyaD/HybD family hydrogenase maturation endopeptidase [Rhodocyclaceae bacterium]